MPSDEEHNYLYAEPASRPVWWGPTSALSMLFSKMMNRQ